MKGSRSPATDRSGDSRIALDGPGNREIAPLGGGLPSGWRFATPSVRSRFGLGCVGVGLNDTFRFECVGSADGSPMAECCEHPAVGCTHIHKVGWIDWVLKDGVWKCPFLSTEKSCGIYETRPVVCRLFPLGVSLNYDRREVEVYRVTSRCRACQRGRKWRVSAWLAANGFWNSEERGGA